MTFVILKDPAFSSLRSPNPRPNQEGAGLAPAPYGLELHSESQIHLASECTQTASLPKDRLHETRLVKCWLAERSRADVAYRIERSRGVRQIVGFTTELQIEAIPHPEILEQ